MLRGLRIALHPEDGQPITLETGKYGPYIKHGTTYASLPKVRSSVPKVHQIFMPVSVLPSFCLLSSQRSSRCYAVCVTLHMPSGYSLPTL